MLGGGCFCCFLSRIGRGRGTKILPHKLVFSITSHRLMGKQREGHESPKKKSIDSIVYMPQMLAASL